MTASLARFLPSQVMNHRSRVQGLLALGTSFVVASSLAGQSADRIAAPRSPREAVDSGRRSIGTGLVWSIGGAVMPIAAGLLLHPRESTSASDGLALFTLAGFLIGPSLGHFYAGQTGRGLVGIGGRVLATVAVGAAVSATWNSSPSAETDLLGVLVLGVVAASTVWDIARVPGSVRRHNVAARHGPTLGITPIAGPGHLGFGGRVAF